MARFVARRSEGNPGAYGGGRERAPFTYQAFVPDPIETLDPPTTFEAADAVAAAERDLIGNLLTYGPY